MSVRSLGVRLAAITLVAAAAASTPALGANSSSTAGSASYELVPVDAGSWASSALLSRDGGLVAMNVDIGVDGTPYTRQVQVWDRRTATMLPVSVSPSGAAGNRRSSVADLTPDGRFVLFNSRSTNLVPQDTNQLRDAFVRDMWTGLTQRVSLSPTGGQLSQRSSGDSMTSDGQVVFFSTRAAIVPADRNDHMDVYARDLSTGTTSLVSVNTRGRTGNQGSLFARASDDGRWVAFLSYATNLNAADRNPDPDVYLRDRLTGHTWFASMRPHRVSRLTTVSDVSISGNGHVVGFNAMAMGQPGDSPGLTWQPFVYRRATGTTRDLLPHRSLGRWGGTGHVNSWNGNLVTIVTDVSMTRQDNRPGSSDVYLRNVRSGGLTLLTRQDSPTADQVADWHELSRDGHVLYFASSGRFAATDTDQEWDSYLRVTP